jgi:hypothetical protein
MKMALFLVVAKALFELNDTHGRQRLYIRYLVIVGANICKKKERGR